LPKTKINSSKHYQGFITFIAQSYNQPCNYDELKDTKMKCFVEAVSSGSDSGGSVVESIRIMLSMSDTFTEVGD
jgi:hypothetical protein